MGCKPKEKKKRKKETVLGLHLISVFQYCALGRLSTAPVFSVQVLMEE